MARCTITYLDKVGALLDGRAVRLERVLGQGTAEATVGKDQGSSAHGEGSLGASGSHRHALRCRGLGRRLCDSRNNLQCRENEKRSHVDDIESAG